MAELLTCCEQTEVLDLDLDPSPDDPDFQMTYTAADLERQMDDIRSGRSETIPWDEVKRRGRAVRA